MNVINDDFLTWLAGVTEVELYNKIVKVYNEWLEEKEKSKVQASTEKRIEMALRTCMLKDQRITAELIANMIGMSDKTVRRSEPWKL